MYLEAQIYYSLKKKDNVELDLFYYNFTFGIILPFYVLNFKNKYDTKKTIKRLLILVYWKNNHRKYLSNINLITKNMPAKIWIFFAIVFTTKHKKISNQPKNKQTKKPRIQFCHIRVSGPPVEVGVTMYVLSISSLSEVKMVLN